MTAFNLRAFFIYKLLNSAFTGLSIGIFFIIYAPLKPITYSIGGIVLALGIMGLAKLYERVMNLTWFYRFSLFVELVVVTLILLVLFNGLSFMTAVAVYSGYQITFMFGSYLVRVESLLLAKPKLLERVDIYKQSGYIIGLLSSYLFYTLAESQESQQQVMAIHYLLLGLEAAVILFLLKGFKKL